MKNLRTLLIIIPSVIAVAAIAGFAITFGPAPQAAVARIFIDLGVTICLVSACFMLPKPKALRTHEICDAIRDLARGRYDRRLNNNGFEEISDIAQAFNELAGTLSDVHDPAISSLRYKFQRPEGFGPMVINELHSHHPELGTVQTAEVKKETSEPEIVGVMSEPGFGMGGASHVSEIQPVVKDHVLELYDLFATAHRQRRTEVVDLDVFKQTIEKTRADLIATHQCKDVRFEVVAENDEIALRPRLIR